MLEQSRRHAFIASLLRVPHLVLCVNKMDLVDYDEERVRARSGTSSREFAAKLDVTDLTFIPISALHGDNVVDHSPNMPWYDGPSLLHHLENVHIASDRNLIDAAVPGAVRDPAACRRAPRLPRLRRAGRRRRVQARRRGRRAAVRVHHDDRRDRHRSTARSTRRSPPMSVTIRLDDDIDVSRGDMICRPHNQPTVGQDIDAMVCWISDAAAARRRQATPSSTRPERVRARGEGPAVPARRQHAAPRRGRPTSSALNEIGRVTLRTTQPLFFDEYRRNRTTGSFILVDEATNDTVGGGMILGPAQ